MLKKISNWIFRKHKVETIRKVYVSDKVIEDTVKALHSFGTLHKPHEGVVYWAGVRCKEVVVVTSIVVPVAHTTPGSFYISAKDNANVTRCIVKSHLTLIGQVHSHPGGAVDHSSGDSDNALMPFCGFLSIVVPNYCRNGMLPIKKCGIHLFDGVKFERKNQDWLESNFFVVPCKKDLRKTGVDFNG